MTFFFIRQETFHVFQCAGNFSLAMAFHDRDIDHKIHLFRTFANLKFHITTLHRHAFFLLRIDKRNAVLFRKHTVSTDLKRFLCLIPDPGTFHDLKVSKSIFLKIFDDPRNHLGCVVPPNSAGTGATKFGLIPMRLTFEGMSVAKAHLFKSCFVISLYSIPCIWIISFLFI